MTLTKPEANSSVLGLGIVGYGHIGAQLSVLAESMGMSVIYYDVLNLMALGTARQVETLEQLLGQADFVTCHVPELPETKGMFGQQQFEQMKQGSYLINASRGTVVDIPALIEAMRSGKVAGAALDVYPNEPAGNGDYFNNELNSWGADLRALKNLILTPHIGGSTEEAQSAIGLEVATALTRYVNEGSTQGAVNMPEVSLRSLTIDEPNHARVRDPSAGLPGFSEKWGFPILPLSPPGRGNHVLTFFSQVVFIHKNIPGVLRRVNEILGDHNVDKQMTDSRGDVSCCAIRVS